MAKVSILIPAYNCASFLPTTIESALIQSWPRKEIIVVDDGSDDNTLAVAREFEARGVRVFSQSNKGACSARNKAFEVSTGDYIQYLDGDDLLSTDKLKNQMSHAETVSDDVVLSSSFIRFHEHVPTFPSNESKKFLDRSWADPIEWLINEWEGRGMGQTSIWLTPRNLIEKAGPWDERLSVNQDGEFFSRVLIASKGIKFCENSYVYYRSGNLNSVSQQASNRKAIDLLLSINLYEQNILKVENSERVRRALAAKYMVFMYAHYDSHPDLAGEARNCLRRLGLPNLPQAGGKNFRLLAKLVGFENSLKLRSALRMVNLIR